MNIVIYKLKTKTSRTLILFLLRIPMFKHLLSSLIIKKVFKTFSTHMKPTQLSLLFILSIVLTAIF